MELNSANIALVWLMLRSYLSSNVHGGIIYDLWEIMGRKMPPECKYFYLPREFLPDKAEREGSDWKYCEMMKVYLQMKRFYYMDSGRSRPWDFQRLWDTTLVEENVDICYALAESISFKLSEKPTIFRTAFPDGSLDNVSKIKCPMFAIVGLPLLNQVLDFTMVIIKGPLIRKSKYGQTYIVADSLGNLMDVIMYEKSSEKSLIKNFCFVFHIYDNEQLIKNVKSLINAKRKNHRYQFDLAKNTLEDVTGNDKYLLHQLQKNRPGVEGKKSSTLRDLFHGLNNCSCMPSKRKDHSNAVQKPSSGECSTATRSNRCPCKFKTFDRNSSLKNVKKTDSYSPQDTITPGSSGPKEPRSSNERSPSSYTKNGKNADTWLKNTNSGQLDSVDKTELNAKKVLVNCDVDLNSNNGELKTVDKESARNREKCKVKLNSSASEFANIREKGEVRLNTGDCESTSVRYKGNTRLNTGDCESTSVRYKGKTKLNTGDCESTSVRYKGNTRLNTGDCESTRTRCKNKTNRNISECKNITRNIVRGKGRAKLNANECDNESISIVEGKGKAKLNASECDNESISIVEGKGKANLNASECDNESISIVRGKSKAKLNASECDNESINTVQGKGKAKLNASECDNESINIRDKGKAKLNAI